jgi:hypothetical protein
MPAAGALDALRADGPWRASSRSTTRKHSLLLGIVVILSCRTLCLALGTLDQTLADGLGLVGGDIRHHGGHDVVGSVVL